MYTIGSTNRSIHWHWVGRTVTNAQIDAMLLAITRTINTLGTVLHNIDELLGMEHVFTARKIQYSQDYHIEYDWDNSNPRVWNNQNRIKLTITIFTNHNVLVDFTHPLLSGKYQALRTNLGALDINELILHFVGQCCHTFITVCPFCGL